MQNFSPDWVLVLLVAVAGFLICWSTTRRVSYLVRKAYDDGYDDARRDAKQLREDVHHLLRIEKKDL